MEFSRELAEELAFGAPFDRTAADPAKARALAERRLELPPHAPWRMPEDLTWREDPFREPNWVAQYHMLRWLDPLRRQAAAGEEGLIDSWIDIAASWIRSNPPGRGRARYSWADMVEAARALTLSFALPVLQDLRPAALPEVLGSLVEHGEWLADPAHIRSGNHALQQHQGLLVLGAVLRRPEWVGLAVDRSVDMLRNSYDDEGINEEGALQYHQINYTWWRLLRRRIEIVAGEAPAEFDRILLAPVGMAHATRPDGRYELIGDTEEFTPRALGHPAIDYVSSSGAKGEAPEGNVKVYGSGYVFGRSTWGDAETSFEEASFYSLRFGPQNRIHGHADGMSLTLYADRGSLLLDSGKYAYDATDPHRAHLLSREAHNSLSVADVEYDGAANVMLSHYNLGSNGEYFRFIDPGYPGVTLTREVLISLGWGLILVLDRFASEEERTVSQWWHLNPAASHRVDGDSVFARTAENAVRLAWVHGVTERRVTKGTTRPLQGWFSPRWRTLVPTRTIEAWSSGHHGELATALSFRDPEQPLAVEAVPSEAGARASFRIRRGRETFAAVFTQDEGQLRKLHDSAASVQ